MIWNPDEARSCAEYLGLDEDETEDMLQGVMYVLNTLYTSVGKFVDGDDPRKETRLIAAIIGMLIRGGEDAFDGLVPGELYTITLEGLTHGYQTAREG